MKSDDRRKELNYIIENFHSRNIRERDKDIIKN